MRIISDSAENQAVDLYSSALLLLLSCSSFYSVTSSQLLFFFWCWDDSSSSLTSLSSLLTSSSRLLSPLLWCFSLSTSTLAFYSAFNTSRLLWIYYVSSGSDLFQKAGIKESVGRRESVRWRISWISFHLCQEALVFSHFLFYSGRCSKHPPSNECVPASVDTHTHTHTHTHTPRRWVRCSGSCRHFRLRLNWGVGSSVFFPLSVGVFSELAFKQDTFILLINIIASYRRVTTSCHCGEIK